MISKQNIAIIILAAGASSRMKSTKQLLPWEGTTLLGNAIRTAKSSDAQLVLVVLGANAEEIRQGMGENYSETSGKKENTVQLVENTDWQSGLGSSIAAGVRHIEEAQIIYDAVLVILADQPLIDMAYLNSMIKNFEDTGKQIVATNYEKRAGVPALFHRSYFRQLKRLSDDRGAQEIINGLSNDALILDPQNKTVDIDTKSEYTNLIDKQKH